MKDAVVAAMDGRVAPIQSFTRKFTDLLIEYSEEAGSNTPDSVFAEYLTQQLVVEPSQVALQIAARIWCDPEMRDVVMDTEAATAIAGIIDDVRCRQAAERPLAHEV